MGVACGCWTILNTPYLYLASIIFLPVHPHIFFFLNVLNVLFVNFRINVLFSIYGMICLHWRTSSAVESPEIKAAQIELPFTLKGSRISASKLSSYGPGTPLHHC